MSELNNKFWTRRPVLDLAPVANPTYCQAPLLIIISSLLCLGALMVFSAGATLTSEIDLRRFWEYATLRRIAFVPLVWLVLAGARNINYRWAMNPGRFFRSPVFIFMVITLILLVLVLIPGVGIRINGARRWLGHGPFRFQPSELAKWTILLFLAGYCCYRGDAIRKFWTGFCPACLALMVTVALIGKEDFGTAVLVGCAGVLVLLIGGVRWYHLLVLPPLAAAGFYFVVYCDETRWARVLAWWQGEAGSPAAAYQAKQSVMSIASGGLFGLGLGQGSVKMGWLPEDTTDFVFAVIAEELGLVGCAFTLLLFVGFIVCGLNIARRAPDRLGRITAVALTGTFGAQAAMNVIVVTGLGPTKGIALPFVSAGGSGLIMMALAASVLLNIAQQGAYRTNAQPAEERQEAGTLPERPVLLEYPTYDPCTDSPTPSPRTIPHGKTIDSPPAPRPAATVIQPSTT